uniref:Uncharacterized protein n=1 Tax=Octopus bimaculoides TaxID=37653 RepID=A0A0L8GB64_OCTBM
MTQFLTALPMKILLLFASLTKLVIAKLFLLFLSVTESPCIHHLCNTPTLNP